MDANLTFNSVVFKESYKDASGSLRRSTARDVNTPDDLIIKTQSYVDSNTKVSGVRRLIRIDRHDVDANGQKYVTSAQLVLAVPAIENSTDLATLVATLKAAVANADLIANVLNNEM
jgi:hypothetical protein